MDDPYNDIKEFDFTATLTLPGGESYSLSSADTSFKVANNTAGHTISGVPTGSTITITEAADSDYTTSAEGKNGTDSITDRNSADHVFSFVVPVPKTDAKTREDLPEEVTFTNTMKFKKVKIIKVGNGGQTDVEAQFTLTGGRRTFLSGYYTTPENNVVYEGKLYYNTLTLNEDWVEDGYRKLDSSAAIRVDDNGVAVSGVSGVAVNGPDSNGVHLITVTNLKTANVVISKTLIDPAGDPAQSFAFTVSATYNGEPLNIGSGASFSMVTGDNRTINVPVGAEITVTEATAGNYTTTAAGTNGNSAVTDLSAADNVFSFVVPTPERNADNKDYPIRVNFINTRNMSHVLIQKTVDGEDTSGNFEFRIRLQETNGYIIKNYTAGIGKNLSGNVDIVTDTAGTSNSFMLQNNETTEILVPSGAQLMIQEIGGTDGENAIDLTRYGTAMNATMGNGSAYAGSYSASADDRRITFNAIPNADIKVVFTNSDAGFDIKFKKTDGFGNALSGAEFSWFTNSACTAALEISGAAVKGISSDGTTKDSSGSNVEKGVVYLEKIPNGVYYLRETTIPSGYTNDNKYLVLVGEDALRAFSTYGLTQADVTAQTAKYKSAYGNDYDKYAIFLIDPTTGKAVTTPDIATYGIMNISTDQRKVILRKTDQSYASLEGAEFKMYYGDMTEMVWDSSHLSASDSNGVFFVGDLPDGVYYLQETKAPGKKNGTATTEYAANKNKWFCVIVDSTGVYQSKGFNSGADDGANRLLAYSEASSKRNTP